MDYRKEFLESNPDKKIKYLSMYSQIAGTSKYLVVWEGKWSNEELINYCDNSMSNFGGRVEHIKDNEDGTKSGTVCVYYD